MTTVDPKSPWEKSCEKFSWLVLIIVLLLLSSKSHGQTNCDKPKLFVGEMKVEMFSLAPDFFNPAMSIGVGVSGIYGKGTLLDNFSGIVGIRAYKESEPDKQGNDRLAVLPTATILYKLRLNGIDSKCIHGIGLVSGFDRKYYGIDYRLYMATTSRSFATLGGIAGWNNVTGYTLGFAVIGIF